MIWRMDDLAKTQPKLMSGSEVAEGDFSPGHILAGKFRIEEFPGKGGKGYVYRVNQLLLNHEYAAKRLIKARSPTSLCGASKLKRARQLRFRIPI
jgi:hypothetical protein